MTTANHSSPDNHPPDELLIGYSAGSLPLSQALCISAHLEHCNTCQRKLQRLNLVGSALMQQLQPSPTSARLKSSILDQLDNLIEEQTPPPSGTDSSVPRCLRQFIRGGYHNLNWKRVSKDISRIELCRDNNGARVELLKIRPGGAVATHTHLGDEYTVVLEGSFSDEKGLYQRGDFLRRDHNDRHTPVATHDRECICLAVSEGPIQLTGFFSRLLNPFIRRTHAG